tara:strand:+ start:211 stop:789 length:579 start_codon:yes stop_codon:yes gene_type:complete
MSFTLLGILNSQAAGGSAPPAFEHLATTIIYSAVGSVTLTGLNSYTDYAHLQLRVSTKSQSSITAGTFHRVNINADYGNNYSYHEMANRGGSMAAENTSPTDTMYLGTAATTLGTQNDYMFSSAIMDFPDFLSTTKYKTVHAQTGMHQYSDSDVRIASGHWRNTSAISSITFYLQSGQFAPTSRFSIYGIRG